MKYHIARGEEKLGEFSDLDVSAGLRDGRFQGTDLCWAPGMNEWEPVEKHFENTTTAPAAEDEMYPATRIARPSQPRPGDPVLASRGQRLMAVMVDWMTMMPSFTLISRAADLPAFYEKNSQLSATSLADAQYEHIVKTVEAHPERFYLPVALFAGLGILNMLMLAMRGQTLGKWLVGVRIVRFQTGANPGFISAVVLRHFIMAALGSIQYVGLGLLVFDIGCIFREDRRCLHDLIADTMVVVDPARLPKAQPAD